MDYPVRFYELLNDRVKCGVCPHHCILSESKRGICGVRLLKDGRPVAINYGEISASAIDPIEKKPLYHFLPGSRILSLGSFGCNMTCQFCQNYEISQLKPPSQFISVAQLIEWMGELPDCCGIAFTYNEPLMWYEYVHDACQSIKRDYPSKKTVIVTNGYIEKEPLERLLPYVDAMNIDLKGYTNHYYNKICGAKLEPVLETIQKVADQCHLEITTLLVSDENDSLQEVEAISKFIYQINPNIPLHLSRYFPRYKLENRATEVEVLKQARAVAKQYLNYVYLGNVEGIDCQTYCPNCHSLLISRYHHQTLCYLKEAVCPHCNEFIPIVL